MYNAVLRSKLLSLLVLVIFAGSASAKNLFEGENFLTPMPKGFKVGYTVKKGKITLTELVPQSESVRDWTKMATIQIFNGNRSDPKAFLERMKSGFTRECEKLGAAEPVTGKVNGYPSAQIIFACTKEKKTGLGSLTAVRAYLGADSFYMVQRAWRGGPYSLDSMPVSTETFKKWMKYLRTVSLCDTRSSDHPC